MCKNYEIKLYWHFNVTMLTRSVHKLIQFSANQINQKPKKRKIYIERERVIGL